jgi:hypothetical protein
MVESQTSGALGNDRLTSQVSGTASGGSFHAERAAATAPHESMHVTIYDRAIAPWKGLGHAY